MRTLLSRPSIRVHLSPATPISVLLMATLDVLAQRFADFSRHCTPRAPLYAHLSLAASHDPTAQLLLQHAPEEQQIPVLFFAAVHHLLLSGLGAELAAHYPNLSARVPDVDPAPAFHAFVRDHSEQIAELVRSRSTQTNEVGRCAQFLPAFGTLDLEVGPLAHIDVGTSAGLNLLLPRYQYHFEPGGVVGGQSAVSIVCATKGPVPVPPAAGWRSVGNSTTYRPARCRAAAGRCLGCRCGPATRAEPNTQWRFGCAAPADRYPAV